jgi:uncharacterized membrane protein
MNKTLLSAVLAGVITAGFSAAHAEDAQAKCYGIAKAGQNACASATGSHSCKGQSKVDNDGGDFTLATAADCQSQGGSNSPRK